MLAMSAVVLIFMSLIGLYYKQSSTGHQHDEFFLFLFRPESTALVLHLETAAPPKKNIRRRYQLHHTCRQKMSTRRSLFAWFVVIYVPCVSSSSSEAFEAFAMTPLSQPSMDAGLPS